MKTQLARLVVSVALFIVLIPWKGWVISTLWEWFVVPVFEAPTLGVVPAVGLSIALDAILGSRGVREAKDGWEGMAESFLAGILFPAVYLLCGWIVRLFL